ncbi:MAG: YbhB/YbcL family Raf kinase inhibitor-like protein [Actinomycetes bacterium]
MARSSRFIALACFTSLIALSACSRQDGRTMAAPSESQIAATNTTVAPSTSTGDVASIDSAALNTPPVLMTLVTPWSEGAKVSAPFVCGDATQSPTLTWTNVPAGTVSLALILTDEDAPDYVHWVAANISPSLTGLAAGTLPSDAIQAKNSKGAIGFTGPCPPEGTTHQYSLTLYALDQMLEFANGDDGTAMGEAISAAALDATTVSFSA